MARQLQNMKADVDIGVRSDARGTVSSTEITSLFNSQIRLLKARGEYRGTRLVSPLDVFDTVFEYAAPTAYKATKLFRPTEGYQDVDLLTSNEWREKVSTTNLPIIADEQYTDSKILLVRVPTDETAVTLEPFAEYDDNGTATAVASTDATNVRTADGARYKQSSAVAFDIDVSASGTNTAGIEKTLTTSVDLSENEDIATGFLDVFIPSGLVTEISSIRLRWGSSSGNYWEVTATDCFNGQDFARGKNVVAFPWSSATETGSPDASAVDYVQVLVSYGASQADVSLVAVQDLRFANPTEYTHEYYSSRFTRSNAGSLQDEFSADDDYSLLEDFEDDMLIQGVIAEIHALKSNYNDSARASAKFEEFYAQVTNNKPSEKQKPSQSYYEM